MVDLASVQSLFQYAVANSNAAGQNKAKADIPASPKLELISNQHKQ
jgi:hypothetical protein